MQHVAHAKVGREGHSTQKAGVLSSSINILLHHCVLHAIILPSFVSSYFSFLMLIRRLYLQACAGV